MYKSSGCRTTAVEVLRTQARTVTLIGTGTGKEILRHGCCSLRGCSRRRDEVVLGNGDVFCRAH